MPSEIYSIAVLFAHHELNVSDKKLIAPKELGMCLSVSEDPRVGNPCYGVAVQLIGSILVLSYRRWATMQTHWRMASAPDERGRKKLESAC